MGTPREDIQLELQAVIRAVFDNDELAISEATKATDIDGWDSMAHVNLIIAIEKRFGVRFSGADLASMRGSGRTIGHLIDLIAAKTERLDVPPRAST
jgi:acyl carrier protein